MLRVITDNNLVHEIGKNTARYLTELQAENKQLKHALSHTNAALADFGDDSIGDMRLKLEDMKVENKALEAERDRYKTALAKKAVYCNGCYEGIEAENDRLKKFIKLEIDYAVDAILEPEKANPQMFINRAKQALEGGE